MVDEQAMQELMSEMNQQQEQQQQMPMVAQQIPSEILELELNYEKSLDGLERKLRGQVLELDRASKQRVWVNKHKPWMNVSGISRIISIIRGHIDINTFLTQLADSEINVITWEVADEVTMILSN